MVTEDKSADVKFFRRVARALDLPPIKLAKIMGVAVPELDELYGAERRELAGFNDHHMWPGLFEHVNKRIGELLAIREELQRKLSADRRKQLERRMATLER